tara:strand:+ start:199 stop:345 length:147 start_codon:yes stop_codon:yes gene_type:complete
MAALRVKKPNRVSLRQSNSVQKDIRLGTELKKVNRSIGMKSTIEKPTN